MVVSHVSFQQSWTIKPLGVEPYEEQIQLTIRNISRINQLRGCSVMNKIPKKGTILSCFFPMNETPDVPGPQARPALVLGTFPSPRDKEVTMIIVAYGTSRKTRSHLGFEIKIDTPEAMTQACLHRPTRFTLNRLRILRYDTHFFDFDEAGSCEIGSLPAPQMATLSSYLDDLSQHSEELNFFRPAEAIKKGMSFDPAKVDNYMKKELTGIQMIRRQRARRNRLYRRA
tara:strand:+ start:508 stop:1191 length:684 start_codon:yes stop_codon:yes gene_type:complete